MEALGFSFKEEAILSTLTLDVLNSRQRLMLNKLLDGFDGKLKTSKWAKITKCSADTALRDINDAIDYYNRMQTCDFRKKLRKNLI